MTTQETDMNLLYILLAILAGIFTTIESSINSQLGRYVTPGIATLHSLLVGMTFILFMNLINGKIVYYARITSIKPIWLIGGLFGASIIYLSSSAIPQLGISNTIILVLSGQMLSGLIVDSVINNVEISVRKMIGLILFLIGAIVYIKD
jgi:bacterial/archaeal transporter family-2 protein